MLRAGPNQQLQPGRRSSKDYDKKQDQDRRDRARRDARPAPLRREDTTLHLVTAFHSFLGRQLEG